MERAHAAAHACLAAHAPALAGLTGASYAAGLAAGLAGARSLDRLAEPDPAAGYEASACQMAWGYEALATGVAGRLASGAALGSVGDRRLCVSGLCRMALAAPDPLRFSLYCQLHDLQMASTPDPAAADLAAAAHAPGSHGGSRDDGPSDGRVSRAPASRAPEAAPCSWGLGRGECWLGVGDLLGPCLVLLDHHYALLEATEEAKEKAKEQKAAAHAAAHAAGEAAAEVGEAGGGEAGSPGKGDRGLSEDYGGLGGSARAMDLVHRALSS
jgi:hypothetical protein